MKNENKSVADANPVICIVGAFALAAAILALCIVTT